MTDSHDRAILRQLATRVAEISRGRIQEERRQLWRLHNSLRPTRPPILVRWFVGLLEIIPDASLACQDPFYRRYERALRMQIFQDWICDDTIIEPWLTVQAQRITPLAGLWGVRLERIPSHVEGGAWKDVPPIKTLADAQRLVRPHHAIDEPATARDVTKLSDAIGDILAINVDRSPAYQVYQGDICTELCYLRGLEQVMWDMRDNPAWLHDLLGFMRDGILATHDAAEAAGDWRLSNHQNQAMPYCLELPDPCANGPSVSRKQLWGYMQAQELTLVSPAMFDEFMLRYQMPIMAPFGLIAYGCCEDLTRKIRYLRQIPNLRRIVVTPWANVRACAEQIGADYVLSWRPNPAEMVCVGFDPDRVRRILQAGVAAAAGCSVEVVLKDIKTVQGEPERLRDWVRIAREVTDHHAEHDHRASVGPDDGSHGAASDSYGCAS